jgi:hypothetical protein
MNALKTMVGSVVLGLVTVLTATALYLSLPLATAPSPAPGLFLGLVTAGSVVVLVVAKVLAAFLGR